MLTTQFLGAGFHGLGAIASTAATTSLQNFLKSIGRYSGPVTGVMNDATMAVIFNLLIESAATVSKIPLLPSDVLRDGIGKVVSALKTADSKMKSLLPSWSPIRPGLADVIKNFTNIQAAVRLAGNTAGGYIGIPKGAGDTAANAMLAARDAVYNAVASQAGIIQKAFTIFFPPAGAAVPGSTAVNASFLNQISRLNPQLFAQVKTASFSTPAAAGGAAAAVPPGTIFARSVKFPGRIRIAIPRAAGGGFAGIGLMNVFGDCILGDCGERGLGAAAPFVETAQTTTPPAGAREVSEKDLEKQTGQTPFFKKPLFWVAVAGGVVVLGGGGYWFVRRRKKVA